MATATLLHGRSPPTTHTRPAPYYRVVFIGTGSRATRLSATRRRALRQAGYETIICRGADRLGRRSRPDVEDARTLCGERGRITVALAWTPRSDSRQKATDDPKLNGCPRNRWPEEWETEVKFCASETPSGDPSAITLRGSGWCLSISPPKKASRRRCRVVVMMRVERPSSGSRETFPSRLIRRGR